ncbi:MAG: DnaB-like helicase C-terminal domain-containing protein, partial [Puniceicoccales bacterium]
MSIESTILGEIICKPGGFNEAIAAGITADAFDGHANRAIFAGLERLKYEGSSVDEIGLIDLWTRDKDAMQGHGFSRLNSVLVEVTSDGNKAHYADFSRHLSILIEDWKRRRLIKAIGKASRMAEDSPEDAAAIVDAISKENAVLGAQKAFANDGTIDRVMQRTEQLIAGQQPASRISIPLVKWDSAFGAIESHELVIIAARPSVGKSSLMVQAAGRTLAKVPDSVIVLFTLEVDEEAVLLQMAAQLAKVDRRNLHREPRNKIEDLRAALERFRAILGN